jgi:hypothetical protein
MKHLILLVFVLITETAGARPAEDFTVFLRHFRTDEHFRVSRVAFPLRVRFGSSCEDDVKSLKWSRPHFTKFFQPPLSLQQIESESLSEQITEVSSMEIRVFQFRDDADSYLMKYTFRRQHGRWFLVGFEDTAC